MKNDFVTSKDFKGTLIEKSFQSDETFATTKDLIEKSAHSKHKYLKIENGKYIYDHSKMTSKDHHDAAEHHSESLERHERLLKEKKSAKDPYSYDSEESYNEAIKQDKNLHKEHENLAFKKEGEERKAKAKDADKKLGNALSNYDKSKDEELYNDKGYNKKGEYNEDFDEEELAKKNTIKKSEAFDILIGNDFEDRIEKSKGPWKKGKHPTESNRLKKIKDKDYREAEKKNTDKEADNQEVDIDEILSKMEKWMPEMDEELSEEFERSKESINLLADFFEMHADEEELAQYIGNQEISWKNLARGYLRKM
jgi:hypothetical protein